MAFVAGTMSSEVGFETLKGHFKSALFPAYSSRRKHSVSVSGVTSVACRRASLAWQILTLLELAVTQTNPSICGIDPTVLSQQ